MPPAPPMPAPPPLVAPAPVLAPAPPPSGLSHETHINVPSAPHLQSRQAPDESAPPQREPAVHAAPGTHMPPPVAPPAPAAPVLAPAPPPSGLSHDVHISVPSAPHMQSMHAPFADAP